MHIKIVSGVPGSGKSTYVQAEIARIEGDTKLSYPDPSGMGYACKFSADDFFVRLGKGTYQFDASKLGEAHGECLRDYVEFIRAPDEAGSNLQDTVFVDNTNTTAIEVAPYASLALAYGHDLEIITFMPGLSFNGEKLGTGNEVNDLKLAFERNSHGVPLKSIQRMQENLKYRRLPAYWPQVIKPFSR